MATYVRWYRADSDLWCYEELDDQRWARRHVEVQASGQAVVAAASLDEVLHARDLGGTTAVVDYERHYGIVPEARFPESPGGGQPALELVTMREFEELWQRGRRACET
ncbi:hypothetical protein OG470_20695 [Micromonospora sp. NBC_00389]|uniref:hypothetical protein n=1 Tax=Micromonospora sp. NBC_00389 TaxID=2903586 RepID=UPI002E1A3FA4